MIIRSEVTQKQLEVKNAEQEPRFPPARGRVPGIQVKSIYPNDWKPQNRWTTGRKSAAGMF